MATDAAFLDARIARTKEMIVAYEDALMAIAGGAQSYTIDTGQTRQVVTKGNVSSMRDALHSWENRLRMLCNERDGGGSFIGRGI